MDDEGVVVRGSIVIPARELVWRFSRSGGPGGQGVNTTDSRVQLSFDLASSPSIPEHLRTRAIDRLATRLVEGRIEIAASESRSQWQNRRAAQLRLAQILDEAMRPPARPRRATRPTRSSVERRLREKRARSDVKRLRRGDPGD